MSSEPKIKSPVMRFIGVADVSRSSVFYRDVLGFDVKQEGEGTEAVCGPARIRFGKEGYTAGEWEMPQPPGSAVLFLEANDVSATRATILARGGTPSEILRIISQHSGTPELLEPSRYGMQDRVDLWFELSSSSRWPSVKRAIRSSLKGLRRATGITFVPELSLGIRKADV